MATESRQTGLNVNLILGKNSDQCGKCGDNYTSDKITTIHQGCDVCQAKPVNDLPHGDPFAQPDENVHEEIGRQEVVPKVEKEDSDDEMMDEEGHFYNILSNVKVTINEKVEGKVNPYPEVSKTNNVKFDDYEFEEVEMKEVINEKEEETPVEEFGVKEEDGFLTPKIEPSNAEDMGPNVLADLVLGFYDRQFLQKTNSEKSEPNLQHTELKCHYCLKQFSKRSALMCHVKDVHEKNGDFACGFCEKRFYRKSALIDHERKHTGEKPFVCVECGKAYDRKSYLNIHMQMHGERYPCDICEKTFSLKKNLGKHIKYVHDKVKNFCCEICSKTFGRTEHLKRHIEDMHEEHGENLHKCDKCDSSFRKEDSLKLHIRYVHENEKNFVCDTCAKAFPRKASLDRHIADVHEQSGSNACQFCEKRFFKPHALKIHERKHTDEKPFACGFCEKKYHRATDKDAHERKHTGETPFQCESCGISFRSQALKRYHMKSHVEVLKQENEHFDPSFLQPNIYNGLNSPLPIMNNQNIKSTSSPSNICSEEKQHKSGESFRDQAYKQDHMNSHEEDLGHSSLQFNPSVLKTNVHNTLNSPLPIMSNQLSQPNRGPNTLYSEEKPYNCERCGESFRNQVLQKDHMNSHGEDLRHRSAPFDPSVLQSNVHNYLNSPERSGESFRSQAVRQDHMKSHEAYLKPKSAQFDPSVLQTNVYNTLYSPSPIMSKHTSPNNTHTEKPFQCEKGGEIFRSQATNHYHIQSHVEVPKHGQFDPSFLQLNEYNHLNSSLPLMKKQTALSRSSQSTTSTEEKPFQCESFRSQAEKQYHMKTREEARKQGSEHDPSVLQPTVYNSLYSSQPIMNNQTVQPGVSPSTNPNCSP